MSQSFRSGSCSISSLDLHVWRPSAVAAALLVVGPSPALNAQALPEGGVVVQGQARIVASPLEHAVTVEQGSARAVINWTSFSIGAGSRVDFRQPSADAAVLNRVSGQAPSTLAGQLTGNGQVILVNPNGIAITSSGSVKVGGGFVASTLDVHDDDFMAGRLQFMGAGGVVSNAGQIEVASGGFAALLGQVVDNSGSISAPLGRAGLGVGSVMTLDLTGDGFLQIGLPSAATDSAQRINHSGVMRAEGGVVHVAASVAREAARQVVNLSGVIEARTASGRTGAIILDSGDAELMVSGRLEAQASVSGTGGQVTLTGRDVSLQSALIDVSGVMGGGGVRIGGDRQGTGNLARADNTTIDASTIVRADATLSGNGGDVVVWSEGRTGFDGVISARGAGASGRGGEAEVSGRAALTFSGVVDLRADEDNSGARTGNLLLDPYNVTISTNADSGAGFSANADNTVINTSTLQNALSMANVTVSTGSSGSQAGNITVSNAVSWSSGNQLTLNAAGGIAVNAALSATGGGGIQLVAGGAITLASSLSVGAGGGSGVQLLANNGVTTSAGSSISTQGQAVVLRGDADSSGQGNLILNGVNINTRGGSLNATGASTSSVDGVFINGATINVGSGSGSFSGVTDSGRGLVIAGNTTLTAATGGAISLSGSISGTSGVSFSSGLMLDQGSVLTASGDVSLSGTALSGATAHAAVMRSGASVSTSSGSFDFRGSASGSSYYGLYLVGNNSIATQSGAMTLSGTSTVNSGTQVAGAVGLSAGSGAISLSASTVASSEIYGAGLHLTSGAVLSTAGAVSISGSASGASHGVAIRAGASISSSSGALLLQGSAANSPGGYAGIAFEGSSTVTAASGDISLTGNGASSNLGLRFTSGTVSVTNGNGVVTLSGTSVSGPGIQLRSGAGLSFAGAVTASGASTSGLGVDFAGTNAVTVSGGNSAVVGVSSSGRGIQIASNAVTTTGGLSVSGTSTSNTGVYIGSAWVHGSGSLSVSGQSSSGGGVLIDTGGAMTNQGIGSLQITSSGSLSLGADVTSLGGLLSLSAGTTVQQTGSGSIYANQLQLNGGAAYSLTSASNQIATLAGSVGSLSLVSRTALTVGVVTTAGLTAAGSVDLRTTGASSDLRLLQPISSAATGDAVVLSSGRNFINDVGPNALVLTGGGRFLVYSADWDSDTVGGLVAGRLYNRSYADYPPVSITASGSQLIYTRQPILSVVADDLSRVYGDANPTLGWSITGLVNGDTNISAYSGEPSLANAAVSTSPVGGYATTVSAGTLASQIGYGFSFTPGVLSVTARPISVSADSQTRVYGDANPALTYTVGGSGLVNGDTLSGGLATSANLTSGVGSYAITQGTLSSPNYTIQGFSGGSLTVTPRSISVSADSQTRVYGDANPALTYTVGGSGLVNGDTLSGGLATSANLTSGVGSYAITQGTLSSPNYTIQGFSGGSLTVTPRSISVSADSQTRVYGDANPALTYTVGGLGLVNGDTLSGGLATSANLTSGVGSYAITQGTLSSSLNYSLQGFSSGSLVVTPRDITVRADPKARLYGEPNPPLTYSVLGGGLVNGDVVTGELTTSASLTSVPGTYAISVGSLAASQNYRLSYAGAELLVRPLSWNQADAGAILRELIRADCSRQVVGAGGFSCAGEQPTVTFAEDSQMKPE